MPAPLDPPNERAMFSHREALFRVLIEQTRDVIGLLDVDGRVLYASPAVRQFGRDPQAMVGRSVWDWIHPDDMPAAREAFRKVCATPGESNETELRGADAAGVWRYKQVLLQNLLDQPQVQAIVLHVRDVHERRLAEEALRQTRMCLEQQVAQQTAELRASEARYRRLVEGLNVDYLFFSSRPQGGITYVSPSVQNVLGYPPEQILQTGFAPYFTANPINRSLEVSRERARAGLPPAEHAECELRHADGSERILEYLDVPVLDEAGGVVAIEGIARDVTARKRAEQQLREAKEHLEERVAERTADLQQLNLQLWEEIQRRERAEEEIRRSEERFRRVVEDQTEFIVRWRPDGTRTFVNASYCRFFGQPAEELLGQSFFPLIHTEEERERVRWLTRRLTPDQPLARYEHRVDRPDGSIAWTQWVDRALFDDQGRLMELQSVGRDITAEKEAEERLRQQEEELTHIARLSVMGEMVAAMGHELGQPLHTISTYASAAQMTLEGRPGEKAAELAEWHVKIQQQVDRAAEIIRRLRDFTRPRATQRQPLDLAQVIRQSLDLVAADFRRRQVHSELVLPPRLPRVSADPIQIEQVLVNLLRNAAEALDGLPPAARGVTISAGEVDGSIRVAVRDGGSGLREEELPRIFEPFFTTKPEGTGIGLAISRRIVTEHGGRIEALPNPEGGMTLAFELPVIAEE